jgi:hypothetical protein
MRLGAPARHRGNTKLPDADVTELEGVPVVQLASLARVRAQAGGVSERVEQLQNIRGSK